jgi:tetratricopeptide (TPR) repeat protein
MTENQELFQQAMNQGHSAAWDQLWDRAASFYRKALEASPNNPQALSNLGLALFEMQDYEGALDCYLRVAAILPNDPIPNEKLAQLYERLGNLERAAQAAFHAAELHMQNRDVNKAIDNWVRVARLNPASLAAHSRLALIYERMGDKQKAVHEFLAVASLLQHAGNLEKAVVAVNHALQLSPNNSDAIQALTLLRDFKPLPKPSRPRGGTAPLRMAKVRQLEAPETPSQSETNLDPVTQAVQKALTTLAGLLFELEEEDDHPEPEARGGLKSLVNGFNAPLRQLDRTRILLHLGQVVDQQTQKSYAQAARELERAIEAGLNHPAAYFNLGYLHYQIEAFDVAIHDLQRAVKFPDYSLAAHLLLGSIYRKLERLGDAAVEYLESLRVADALLVPEQVSDALRQLYEPLIEAQRQQTDPQQQGRVCINIADLLMRADWRAQLARARQQLPAAENGKPPIPIAEFITEARSSQIVESLSTIYDLENQGKTHSAMEEILFALQYAPTYLPLHQYMGELLVKENHIQEATAKFMVVARTYSTRGEARQAISIYKRILELAPMDLTARTRLIEQLMATGNLEAVLQEYLSMGEVYYNLADLEMTRKTYTEALRIAQQSGVDRSWRIQILHRMADIDMQSLDWRQALRIFEQIRTLQPDDEKARANLVELNFRLAQDAQAMNELENAVSTFSAQGDKSRGIEFIENLVKENPERMAVRRKLVEMHLKLGQIKNAIGELDSIGDMLLQSGDKAGAIKTIEAILALNPPNKADYKDLLEKIKDGPA